MCGSDLFPDLENDWDKPRTWLDPAGIFDSAPDPPALVPPPDAPTEGADQVYGAKDDSDEPQLLGTSALQIPLKTVQ